MTVGNETLSNLLAVLTAFSLQAPYNEPITFNNIYGNSMEKQQLFDVNDDDLVLYLTGDPQFYWKCERTNENCINFSKQYRSLHNLNERCQPLATLNTTNCWKHDNVIEQCKNIEAEYSNAIQSKLLAKMALTLRPNSSSLIINGDLTAYGHPQEFCAFSKFWLHFPIELLPGLGNHDYENNIDDCFLNHCANRMLSWLVSYGQKNNLKLDYIKVEDNSSFVDSYVGSFAYAKTVCSENGVTCARIIQLHNRLGYTTKFVSLGTDWTVKSNIPWFDDVMKSYRNSTLPIFINVHHLDRAGLIAINQAISKYFNNSTTRPQIFVLFTHFHSKHEIQLKCIGYQIPFIYVGSIPNNRFTIIDLRRLINGHVSKIYLMSADSENTASIKQYMQPTFATC